MSGYNPYADIGHQPNGAPLPPNQAQPRPPVAPGPTGYQQGTPYGQDAPNLQQTPYGGPQQEYGQPPQPQSQSYFPSQGQNPGVGESGSMGGLTSQMGGIGLGQDPAAARPQKKKNRHAYHNLDQQTVSSQAFNQSMGNAPQYVNQDDAQAPHTGQPYGGQPFSPQNAAAPYQGGPASFSPGIQQAGSPGMKGVPQPRPPPNDQGVSAQGNVDPEQIPSVPRARDGAANYYLQHVYPTMEQHIPPPGGIPYVAQDQGNSSPKFARLTLNNIPASADALSATGLPLGLVLQPLASLQAGEQAIPVLDFGDVGPPRCRRCRAYVNPFMVFRSGGNKLVCNMCTFPNDVGPEYFAPTDPTGVRVDRPQRPELTTGTVEYLVPKEYWAKEPVGLRWLFLIDVSLDANEKGFVRAFCRGILEALYGDDLDSDDEKSDEDSERNQTPNQVSDKIQENLEKAQMLVMPDIEEAFVPLGSDGLFVDPYKSKPIIVGLLRLLPKLFTTRKAPEPTLLPTLESAISSLAATGGKIVCSLASLPTIGPGKLFLRDKGDLHGIETEKKLFQTEHPAWRKIAAKMVETGVGIDFFVGAAGGKYMDVATIGHASAVSGGETYFYPNFVSPRDSLQLAQDIRHTVTRETGYQALMKVRCSNGLQVSSYHGNFTQHTFGADLEFGVIDADKAVGVMFSYDGKLDPKLDAHFQCALLYTTATGERRVRCTNTVASVNEGAAECMRFIDQDAVVNIIAKEAATRMLEKPLKDIRNALTEKTIDILSGYRKSFSSSHPPGQLVLPENLKEFSMYILGLIKSRAFKAVSPNLLEDLFGPNVTALSTLDPGTSTLPVLDTHLNAQVRNILAYWGSFRGSRSGATVPFQVARQGFDGAEFEFARCLVEDRNNEAQSYVDWLVNVHRHIQMELAGQRRKDDGGGGGAVEGAMAGITSLWTGTT
ncbi:uncharacterized protein KY384_006221 [Bacidia gigantensis]|uniref:uncharacterized protein n=1 Tax=Bacidia gigantensis TaxID=2732470 RepID=UPI001D041025|nr:uncharacterized protein KY384_006221 [Bacidia gigantensis]KAG8529584.1 hypothetical protein KY384_006221 [Bacidia gigantensis]